jgi:hypothetical protein
MKTGIGFRFLFPACEEQPRQAGLAPAAVSENIVPGGAVVSFEACDGTLSRLYERHLSDRKAGAQWVSLPGRFVGSFKGEWFRP